MNRVRRHVLGFLGFVVAVPAVVAIEYGISEQSIQRPHAAFTNVAADRDMLRSEFASEPWSTDIVAAAWNSAVESLDVQSGTDNAQTAFAICDALVGEVDGRFPDGHGGLLVFDPDANLLVSKNGGRCYWRQ